MGETNSCAIAVPEQRHSGPAEEGPCRGAIAAAAVENRGGKEIIRIEGWSAAPGPEGDAADAVFLVLSAEGKAPVFADTLAIPRLDVNRTLGLAGTIDLGFSRLLLASSLAPGRYEIGIIRQSHGRSTLCPMTGQLLVGG